MSISKDDVAYVADLSRLSVTEIEKENFAKDMSKILEYMELLNQVDTSKIKPLEHVTELTAPFRKDVALPSLDHDLALKNAPDADTDYFRVPKVIE